MKDHGSVDFRRIYSEIDLKIKDSYYSSTSGVPIVKSIRNEILPSVTQSTCFETKYNAMNVLADIGVLLMEISVYYNNRKLTSDTLFGALSSIGQMFSEEEVAQVLMEMQSEKLMSEPGFLSKFLADMELDPSQWGFTSSYDDSHYHARFDYAKRFLQREMLKSAVGRTMSQTRSVYGQRGLLVEILCLRFYDGPL